MSKRTFIVSDGPLDAHLHEGFRFFDDQEMARNIIAEMRKYNSQATLYEITTLDEDHDEY